MEQLRVPVMTGQIYPLEETFAEVAARVSVGLFFLTASGSVIAFGYGSRSLARLFMAGAATMLLIRGAIAIMA
jgi:hypothetical protein